MVFSSIEFLFYFLPAAVGAYFLAPVKARNAVLLTASLIFYLWGSGALILLLLGSIGLNFLTGKIVEHGLDRRDRRTVVLGVSASVAVNVALLCYFKYANFLVAQFNALGEAMGTGQVAWDSVILPIGISFYTFQAMSYIFDVARGASRPARSIVDFALYVSMFPQLVAGPIVRYSTVAGRLVERQTRFDDFVEGAQRFALGLVKKVVVADSVAPIADAAFQSGSGDLTFAGAWVGLTAYTIQIYFDFSAYSDMAIGLGRIFGFRFPENFDRPYSAHSVTEFWRRWHMSLSSWFRDYLYIPLGGSRGSAMRTYANLWIVFIIVGLWHGASWTFIVWGVWHGLLLVTERLSGWRTRRFEAPAGIVMARAVTLFFVMMGWVMFRADDIPAAIAYYQVLLAPSLDGLPSQVSLAATNRGAITLGLACLVFFLPRTFRMPHLLEADGMLARAMRVSIIGIGYPYALVLVISGAFSAFIYFQF